MIEADQPFMFIGAKKAVRTVCLKNMPQSTELWERNNNSCRCARSGPQATDVSGPSLFCPIGVPITDCHAV
ncbi:hypothetical protein T07_5249 [Trichinella nelsoni]|uniref:Uncharacterized protein n=1 Tax=Trichinella nelsoni TaxID=6336 RepID=A0A0V0S1H1_9BILA|nr:hypothetical protein T07_5249 [Trichinella nelsoni]